MCDDGFVPGATQCCGIGSCNIFCCKYIFSLTPSNDSCDDDKCRRSTDCAEDCSKSLNEVHQLILPTKVSAPHNLDMLSTPVKKRTGHVCKSVDPAIQIITRDPLILEMALQMHLQQI